MSRIAIYLINGEWDAFLGLAILLLACFYAMGIRALWQRAGIGHGISVIQAGFFGAGVITLALALASPLHPLGEMLFSAHMLQHLLLISVAAPLLILGMPVVAIAWALPYGLRRLLVQWWMRQPVLFKLSKWWNHPLWVGGVFGATLWLWHVPGFYQAALQNDGWHALEHSTFLAAALLFWWVATPAKHANAQRRGFAILLLMITAMHSAMLGALITLAPTPWYDNYRYTTLIWATTPLADQQLAGVLMWWPMGLVFGGAILWHLAAWLNAVGVEIHDSEYGRS